MIFNFLVKFNIWFVLYLINVVSLHRKIKGCHKTYTSPLETS